MFVSCLFVMLLLFWVAVGDQERDTAREGMRSLRGLERVSERVSERVDRRGGQSSRVETEFTSERVSERVSEGVDWRGTQSVRSLAGTDPTSEPSSQPTVSLTHSSLPSTQPSSQPSDQPTLEPTLEPTQSPVTSSPTVEGMTHTPTMSPSLTWRLPPAITDCRFSSDGRYFQVDFDMDTDRGGHPRKHICSELFNFTASLTSECMWISEMSVRVYSMKNSSNVNSSLVELGDEIQLNGDVLRARCPSHAKADDSECQMWATSSSHTCFLASPLTPVTPVVSISAPSITSQCLEYLLDLTSSTGSGGRDWMDFRVTLTSKSGTGYSLINRPKIYSFYSNNYTFYPPLAMPSKYFIGNEIYYLEIELCNFLGQCGSSSTSVIVLTTLTMPWVTIAGAPKRKIKRSDSLDLQSSAYITDCSGDKRKSNLRYVWDVSENRTSLPSLVSYSRDETRFKLASFQLTVGVIYTFTLTVTDLSVTFGESVPYVVEVEALPSNLVAIIEGGSSQSWRVGDTLVLDSSSSYDADSSESNLTHEWMCDDTESLIVPLPSNFCSRLLNQISINSTIVALEASFLDLSTVVGAVFTMGVNISGSYGRSDYTEVTLTIRDSSAAAIRLISAPKTVTNMQHLRIKTSVSVAEETSGQWSINDSDVILANVSRMHTLSPTLPYAGSYAVNLAIRPLSLISGLSYKFSLSLQGTSKSSVLIDVLVVEAPVPGAFQVTPTSGIEFEDKFDFTTSKWSGDHLPFSYSFGHFTSAVTPTSIQWSKLSELQARSEYSFTRSAKFLPRGRADNDNILACGVLAFNYLGASDGILSMVRVMPSVRTPSEFKSYVAEKLQQGALSQDIDDLRTIVSVGVSILNEANCTLAPTDCLGLGRMGCYSISDTCGPCLSGFEAENIWDDNSQCFSTSILEAEAKLNNNFTCATNSDCKVTQSCQDGFCVYSEKLCPLNCSGHGTCEFKPRMVSILAPPEADGLLDSCTVDDRTCFASCYCDDGYAGSGCSDILTDLITKQETRLELIQYTDAVLHFTDNSSDSLNSLAFVVSKLGVHAPELTTESCTTLQLMIRKIFNDDVNLDLNYDNFEMLLQVLDNCDFLFLKLIAEYPSQSAEAIAVFSAIDFSRDLRHAYLTLATRKKVLGEEEMERTDSFTRSTASLTPLNSVVQQAIPVSALERSLSRTSSVLSMEEITSGENSDTTRYIFVEENDHNFYFDGSSFTALPVTVSYSLISESEISDSDRYITFVVTLPSLVSETFVREQNSSEWLFKTECSPLNDTAAYENFTCPDGRVLTHRCNSRYETYISECPQYRFIPSCRILTTDISASASAECDVLSYTSHNVSCNCTATMSEPSPLSTRGDLWAGLDELESYISIEVVSESIVSYEFPLIEHHHVDLVTFVIYEASLSVIILFAVLWGCGLLGVYEVIKDRYICTTKVKPSEDSEFVDEDSSRTRKNAKSARATILAELGTMSLDTNSKRQYILRYINDILPCVFRSSEAVEDPAWKTLWSVLKKHHRYAVMFTAEGDAAKDLAVYKWLQLLSIQAMLMFVLAVFFTFQFPEDESQCSFHLDRATCEEERSLMDSTLLECVWLRDPNAEHGVCTHSPVQFSVKVIFLISALCAASSAPYNVFVDVIFEDILTAPLANEFELSMKAQRLKGQKKQLKLLAASNHGVVRKSIALANTAVSPMFSRVITTKKSLHKRKNQFSKFLEYFILPGAYMRQVPPSIVDARVTLSDILRDSFQDDHDNEDVEGGSTRQSTSKMNTRMTVMRMSMILKKSIEDDSFPEAGKKVESSDERNLDMAAFSTFMSLLKEQGDGLAVDAKLEFQRRWGYDHIYVKGCSQLPPQSVVHPLPPSTVDIPKIRFCDSHSHLPCASTKSRQQTIQKAISDKQAIASDKFCRLKLARDVHAGMEILHLFIMDLLGRQSSAAKIFNTMTREDFKHSIVVTKAAKRLAWTTMLVINMFFVLSSVGMGMIRSKDWQRNYLIASLIQIIVELLFYQTAECVWIHFAIPRLIIDAVDATLVTIHQCIQAAFQCEVERTILNTPAHFFVSWDLAERFQHIFESSVVLAFQSFFPSPFLDLVAQKGEYMYHEAEEDLLFRFLNRINSRSLLVSFMLWTGTAPIRMQQAILHTMMPIIIAILIMLFAFLVANPILFSIPLGLFFFELISLGYVHYYGKESPLPPPINDVDKNIRSLEEYEMEKTEREERSCLERKEQLKREAIAADFRERKEKERKEKEDEELRLKWEREQHEKKELKEMKKEAKKIRQQMEKEEHQKRVQEALNAQELEAKKRAEREAIEKLQRDERMRKLKEESDRLNKEAQEQKEREAWELKEAKIRAIREQKQKERQAIIDKENHKRQVEDILDKKSHDEVRRAIRARSTSEDESDVKASTLMKMLGVQFLKNKPRSRPKLNDSALKRDERPPPTWEEHKESRAKTDKDHKLFLEKQSHEARASQDRQEKDEEIAIAKYDRERDEAKVLQEVEESKLKLDRELEKKRVADLRAQQDEKEEADRALFLLEVQQLENNAALSAVATAKNESKHQVDAAGRQEKQNDMMNLLQMQVRKSSLGLNLHEPKSED